MTVNQILPFPLLFLSLPSSSTPSSSRTALGQPSTWRVLFQTIPIDEVNATSLSHAPSYSVPYLSEKTEAASFGEGAGHQASPESHPARWSRRSGLRRTHPAFKKAAPAPPKEKDDIDDRRVCGIVSPPPLSHVDTEDRNQEWEACKWTLPGSCLTIPSAASICFPRRLFFISLEMRPS